MRNFIYFLVSLLAAMAIAFVVHYWLSQHNDPGYVLIGFEHWSLETSLVIFSVVSVLGFFVLYVLFRLLGWLLRFPGTFKHKKRTIKFNRSQEALVSGLIDVAEGNFEQAENILVKHATHSGAPLIHYLTAAKAAQSRGAFEKRDEYLQLATQNAPGSEIAVGLTEAELHLTDNQFDLALDSLTRIQSMDPTHASILKLLHKTYRKLGDWQALQKLIPDLKNNQILMETELKLLETETYSMLLREAAQQGSAEHTQKLWAEVPEHIKSMQGISAIYYAAMIEINAGAEIEDALFTELEHDWNDTLLILYGSIESKDPVKQLRNAEKWLDIHPGGMVLLRVLGKLCISCGEVEKADHYLTQSINVEPSVAAFQLLGDLLYATNNKERASDCYKHGMELASGQVVTQVEQLSQPS